MAISGLIKDNSFNEIKIVCGGMAATPLMAIKTQKFLLNKKFTQENIDIAKKIILTDFQPLSDMRASSNYRSLVSQNLLERSPSPHLPDSGKRFEFPQCLVFPSIA